MTREEVRRYISVPEATTNILDNSTLDSLAKFASGCTVVVLTSCSHSEDQKLVSSDLSMPP